MKTNSIKRNVLLFITLAVAIIALGLALLIRPVAHADRNIGNNAGNDNPDVIIDLVLDVNGRVPESTDYDTSKTALENHNSGKDGEGKKDLLLRTRYIQHSAVREYFGQTGSWVFLSNSIINGSTAFDVNTLNNRDVNTLVVTANAITETGSGRFCVTLVDNAEEPTKSFVAYFRVTVMDTFAQWTSDEQALYVGNKVRDSDGKEYVTVDGVQVEQSSLDGFKHKPIMDVYNYSKITIDLGEVLLDRALFADTTTTEGTVTGTTPRTELSGRNWTLHSVTNFAIDVDNIRFEGLSGVTIEDSIVTSPQKFDASTNTPPIRVTPKVIGNIAVDDKTIRKYTQQNNVDFWDVTHVMNVPLKIVTAVSGRATSVIVKIPVSFVPANPQPKSIAVNLLRLNVTSTNVYDLASETVLDEGNNIVTELDYCSIYVRPSDLIEYSKPDSYLDSTFSHSDTTINGINEIKTQKGIRIDRMKEDYTLDEDIDNDNTIPTMYRITATPSSLANTNFKIKFKILYYTGKTTSQEHDIDVTIDISTYGGYSVAFSPIKGKKPVEYNALNAEVFAAMRQRGYLLTAVKSLNEKQLGVSFENNILKLDPHVKAINGQTTATVLLTFTNSERQVITFESETINIDVDAGSIFARFDDWQAWLIIAACILAGILLILLIVWIFIHSLSKHKQDELAMQAPVSSYIVKLNSTIAQTQAQQRMQQQSILAGQMLLGAGAQSVPGVMPDPNTLQLASGSGVQSQPAPIMSTPSSGPQMSEPQATVPPDSDAGLEELIAKYITDDELLERIFTEKYEPKGMVRRTFFKSKDLQTRELEKEKKRIIERYKTPMPMDEAIMSEAEINAANGVITSGATSEPAEETQSAVTFVLDFDPDSPLYVEPEKKADEFSEEKIDLDVSPEEARLRAAEHRADVLEKELAELNSRLAKCQAEVDRAKSLEDELREHIAKAEADDSQYAKDIEELEFKLASARGKDKEKITRDIGIKEEKKQRNADELEKLRIQLELITGSSSNVYGALDKLLGLQKQKNDEKEQSDAELAQARAEYEAYMERMEKVRQRQELEAKVQTLIPLLQAVDNSDYEMRRLEKVAEEQAKEREKLKSEIAQAKSSIMGTSDFGVIADLNSRISDTNAQLAELEREITKGSKVKSDLQIEFNSQRRQANEFCTKNDIPVEEVVRAEDDVIGAIEFELLKAVREKDKQEAEAAVATAQAVYEDLAASSNDVTMLAMDVAAEIGEIEDEIAQVQSELDDINARMETAGEDENLDLMVAQGDTTDRLEALKAKLEQANVDGTKRKMEAQAEYDEKLENARVALARANEEYEQACASFDDFVNNTNPLDLIVSGSGIISVDQKKLEAENLKKQLEKSKLEAEQARMAAQQAHEQAEEARRKAQEESEEARLEAERLAQEAIERAEQARREAEEKAKADIEAAEQARREAEEAMAAEAEEAKRRAQEESEEAKRLAEEQAEQARKEAEEQAEKTRQEAEEAKRLAEEQAEQARREAEEQAEEAKRKAQEEIEEMKRKAEEEEAAKRAEEEARRAEEEARQKAEQERADALAKKIALRKDQIIAIRGEMKELKGDEDAKKLRERLYNLQLSFDEEEHGSTELMDFYNKTMDDITAAGEIARLKAENARKPQRVVRKVTERVNRIAKKKPRPKSGARPGQRPGARSAQRAGARPASRSGARPAARKPGQRPAKPGGRPSSGNRPRPR